MAKRKKKQEVPLDTDGWIATFSDLVSLMLTFFVLLISMSSLDENTMKEVSGFIPNSAVSVFYSGPGADMESLVPQKQRKITTQEMYLALRQKARRVLTKSAWKHKVNAHVYKDRMVIRMPDTVLFEQGRAKIRPQDMIALKRVARMLAAVPGSVRVEGHTNATPLPAGSPFPDLWALSLARSASVLHVLEAAGVSRKRLSLAGYGPSKPISLDVTPIGQRKNRRVDIVIYKPKRT